MAVSDCIFCKIIAGEIPAKVVYEDHSLMAIEDINPIAPVHIILMPKKHIASLHETTSDDIEVMGHLQVAAAAIAREQGIADEGYRLVNNCGEKGGQLVMHVHYHLFGGRELLWPPG